jgi:hypothetical protein
MNKDRDKPLLYSGFWFSEVIILELCCLGC